MRRAHPPWPRVAHTSAGVRYHVRPLVRDDAARERDFFARLGPNTRYQRFQFPLREPSDALIERLLDTDPHHNVALAALVGDAPAESIVGVARYAAEDEETCEFAVVVADDWQGRGIGTTLMKLLFDYAEREGFKVIYGNVLAENTRMIELCEALGLTVEPSRAHSATVRAWRRLGARAD